MKKLNKKFKQFALKHNVEVSFTYNEHKKLKITNMYHATYVLKFSRANKEIIITFSDLVENSWSYNGEKVSLSDIIGRKLIIQIENNTETYDLKKIKKIQEDRKFYCAFNFIQVQAPAALEDFCIENGLDINQDSINTYFSVLLEYAKIKSMFSFEERKQIMEIRKT